MAARTVAVAVVLSMFLSIGVVLGALYSNGDLSLVRSAIANNSSSTNPTVTTVFVTRNNSLVITTTIIANSSAPESSYFVPQQQGTTKTDVSTSTVMNTSYSTITQTVSGPLTATEGSNTTVTQTMSAVQTVMVTQNVTTTAGNLVNFSIDSLVLNSTSDSWTLVLTNFNGNDWNIHATLTATSGSGGSATDDSNMNIFPFPPGVDSNTVSGVGPKSLKAGNDYCVLIAGQPTGSTVQDGYWSWTSCFIQAV